MKYTRILTIAALLAAFSHCKKDDVNLVEEDPTLKAEAEVFVESPETELAVEFYDAKTGASIESPVAVTISGNDVALITEQDGASKSAFTSEQGLLFFSTSKIPTDVNPVDISIVAHLDGYVSTSKRLLAYEKGLTTVRINMVKVDDTPAGVSAVVNSDISTSTGVTAAEVIIETSATSGNTSTTTKTTVTVPSGLEMKDKDGNVLKGEVKSTLVYFSTEEDASLTSFPGGFQAVVNNNNTDEDGVFTTAGFVSLEMEVGGTKVSTFSKPITITTEVPAATINPETGNTIQTGETIDVWSYDTESGEWKYETTATFGSQLANGNFEATMTPNHLSYWNLDWFTVDGVCSSRLPVTFNVPALTEYKYIEFELINKQTGRIYRRKNIRVKNGETEYFYNLPKNIDFTFRASSCSGFSGELDVSACTSSNLTFNLTQAGAAPTISITGDVSGYCPQNPTVLIKPSGWLGVRKAGSNCRWSYVFMNKGKCTVNNLEVGGTYEGRFWYNRKWHYRTATITSDKTNYTLTGELPAELCQ